MSVDRDAQISSSTSTTEMKESSSQANASSSGDEDDECNDNLPDFSAAFLFSDITLQVEDKVLHSHKAILSMWSPVFRAMFTNKCRESTSNVIVLSEDKYSDIIQLLKFFYVPGGRDMDSDIAICLLPVIHRYQVENLLEIAERRLTSNINDHNVITYMQLAELYSLSGLQTATLERCARLETSKLNKDITESTLAPDIQLKIYKRRSIFLEQCIQDINRSFIHSCIKVESKLERLPANHCSKHTKPLSKDEEEGQCADCVENFKNHILDLCKRALHKPTIVICKDQA